MHIINSRRIYSDAEPDDGYRVLVDRLWPRGISKERAALGEWRKTIAPSDALRQSYGHDPALFGKFSSEYESELDANPDAEVFAEECRTHLKKENITLLYAAKDGEHSNAAVLVEWLERRI